MCWISAGISSFIAGYLERETIDEFIYIDVADQHYDSMRFVKDCEKLLGKEIQIMQSDRYSSVEDVILGYGVIKNPYNGFAPCTNVLKKEVRKIWEQEHNNCLLTYVWGFDVDEKHRAENLIDAQPSQQHVFPLIEKGLTKQDCHAMAERLGIKRPYMYDMGYQNNNCVGCVKGGMWYWNKIRRDFPDVFEKRAKMERFIGASILKDHEGTPIYLDELEPNRGRKEDEISTDCGVMCYLNLR